MASAPGSDLGHTLSPLVLERANELRREADRIAHGAGAEPGLEFVPRLSPEGFLEAAFDEAASPRTRSQDNRVFAELVRRVLRLEEALVSLNAERERLDLRPIDARRAMQLVTDRTAMAVVVEAEEAGATGIPVEALALRFARSFRLALRPYIGDVEPLIQREADRRKLAAIGLDDVQSILVEALAKDEESHIATAKKLILEGLGGDMWLTQQRTKDPAGFTAEAKEQIQRLVASIQNPGELLAVRREQALQRPALEMDGAGSPRPVDSPERRSALAYESVRLNIQKLVKNWDYPGFGQNGEIGVKRLVQARYEDKRDPFLSFGNELRRAALRAEMEHRPLRILELTDGIGLPSIQIHGSELSTFGDWLRDYKQKRLPIQTVSISDRDLLRPYLAGEIETAYTSSSHNWDYLRSAFALDRLEDARNGPLLLSRLGDLERDGRLQRRIGDPLQLLESLIARGERFDIIIDTGGLMASPDRARMMKLAQAALVEDGLAYFPVNMWFEGASGGMETDVYLRDRIEGPGPWDMGTLGGLFAREAPGVFFANQDIIVARGTASRPKLPELTVRFDENQRNAHGYPTAYYTPVR